jgi:hypothetical protein
MLRKARLAQRLLPIARWRAIMRLVRLGVAWLALVMGCDPPDRSAGPTCTTIATEFEIAFTTADPVDLLVVIDDSASNAQERAAMQSELLELMRLMLTGDSATDSGVFAPLRNAHIGVVSADLGANGRDDSGPGCNGWGDGGAFVAGEAGETCVPSEPAFLRYRIPTPTAHPWIEPPSDAPVVALLAGFECSAAARGESCGYGQPFEAALRALWAGTAEPELAREDAPAFSGPPPEGDGANAAFLRDDPVRGISLVHVLLVTDGDDCSASDPMLFAGGADAASPETHCAERADLLQPIERYVSGLRALRPEQEHLVSFAAIAGVPPDLLGADAAIDSHDDAERDAAYWAILADPRMQPAARADGTLQPSCESEILSATPPRRVVELARAFGPQGRLHSICDSDWSGAVQLLNAQHGSLLGAVCLNGHELPRARNGLTNCSMVWELPPPEHAPDGTPTSCSERAFLSPDEGHPRNERGGAVCEVHQLAVTGAPASPELEPGEGWFYDDFSVGAHCACAGRCNEIFFAPDRPPPGVTVKLRCTETRRSLPPRDDLDTTRPQPDVFDRCDPDEAAACSRSLADGAAGASDDRLDRGLRCHPTRRQCLLACEEQACPAGWSCSAERFCEPLECAVPG